MLKITKGKKILKKQKIQNLQIIEYMCVCVCVCDYIIEKYKRKIYYHQKNNSWS